MASPGTAWVTSLGMVGMAQVGTAQLSPAWPGPAWQGIAEHSLAGLDLVSCPGAGFGSSGPGMASPGTAWHSLAEPSSAQPGEAGDGLVWLGSAQLSVEKPKLGTAQLVARLGTAQGGMLLLSFLPADAARPRGEDFPAHFPPPVPVLALHRAPSSPGPFSSLAGLRARGGARTGLGTRGWGHREAQTVDGLRVLCILCFSSGCSSG